mgnify:CR=1 FL=1
MVRVQGDTLYTVPTIVERQKTKPSQPIERLESPLRANVNDNPLVQPVGLPENAPQQLSELAPGRYTQSDETVRQLAQDIKQRSQNLGIPPINIIRDYVSQLEFKIDKGLSIARQLLRDINDLGLPAGTEFLDVITPQYIADLISWGAIGARTTESQVHRELASGSSCPIGFKNTTDGGIQVAADAIGSAQNPHKFLSVTKEGRAAIFYSSGNKDCHVILRGGSKPNYSKEDIDKTANILQNNNLVESIMVDMSHGNSSKQHKKQLIVCEDISKQISLGEDRITGVMIESNIEEGNQSAKDLKNLVYGQSITDACINWKDTKTCLNQLAEAVSARENKT